MFDHDEVFEVRRVRRGNSRYFIILFLILILLGGLFFGARLVVLRLHYFDIDKIEITGNVNLPRQFYFDLLSDFQGRNLFAVSGDEVREKFGNIARVKTAVLRRVYPSTMKVEITERIARFYLKTSDGCIVPVDKDRVVLDNTGIYATENPPVIDINADSSDLTIGKVYPHPLISEVDTLQTIFEQTHPKFARRISEYYRQNGEIYFVDSKTGSRVIIGRGDIAVKIRRLIFFAENQGIQKNMILDLRYKDQIITRVGTI